MTQIIEVDGPLEVDSDPEDVQVMVGSGRFGSPFENGRRYHGYKDGAYFLPNDKREQDRLDLQHSIYRGVLNGHLYLAPIGANPKRVLDLGTGTGNWAAEFAEQHPKSQVLGSLKPSPDIITL
ncbi:hypothetical protein FQN52_005216 [Onygenales sp. PD_12]|nr:hypothetical protein FQN52_005216 [Onygenales sp. PD_12]